MRITPEDIEEANTFTPDDRVMHKQTRYVGKVLRVNWPQDGFVQVRWNLGFTDYYPATWLEIG